MCTGEGWKMKEEHVCSCSVVCSVVLVHYTSQEKRHQITDIFFFSGQVRPRQETENLTFSPVDFSFSPVDFSFSPDALCNLVRKSPQDLSGENSPVSRPRKMRKLLSHLWLSWFFWSQWGGGVWSGHSQCSFQSMLRQTQVDVASSYCKQSKCRTDRDSALLFTIKDGGSIRNEGHFARLSLRMLLLKPEVGTR